MRIKCRSICLGSYIKWDTKKHVEIIKRELGWKGQEVEGIPPEYDYEKIECIFQGVRDYLQVHQARHSGAPTISSTSTSATSA